MGVEDRLYKYLKYYSASPQWLKRLLGGAYRRVPLSIRYGRAYTECIRLLERTQWWSREELAQYQWRRLEALLNHAYQHVPYYRRVLDERGLKPKDIQDFEDFRQVPFLTKEIIRHNRDDLLADNYSRSRRLRVETGGSTGSPLVIQYEKGVSRAREWAFLTTLWRRVGYKFGDRMAVLEHHVVRSARKGKPWSYDPTRNRLVLSIYHMDDDNIPKYIEKIRQFTPKYIHAFPSALMVIARFAKLNGIPHIPGLRGIFCCSENLFPEQRTLFEEVFKCRVLNWYGQSELVTLAGGCEESDDYHLFPEYGVTELVGNDGNAVTEEGGVGEVVGTGFNNWLMPLIRYRTSDLAVHTNCGCHCGRAYPLLRSINGRSHEFFVARDNSLIPLLGNYDIVARMMSSIKDLQFVQDAKGQVKVQVVKEASSDGNHVRSELLRRLKERSGDLPDVILDFEITFVREIPKTKRAKQRLLVQNVPFQLGVSGGGCSVIETEPPMNREYGMLGR